MTPDVHTLFAIVFMILMANAKLNVTIYRFFQSQTNRKYISEITLNGVNTLSSNAFNKASIGALKIKNSYLKQVSLDLFKNIIYIRKIIINNVSNFKDLFDRNRSIFLQNTTEKLDFTSASNFSQEQFSFLLNLTKSIGIKKLEFKNIELQNLEIDLFDSKSLNEFSIYDSLIEFVSINININLNIFTIIQTRLKILDCDFLKNIQTFLVHSNPMESIYFENLSNLSELILSNNMLTNIQSSMFINLKNLSILNLNNNNIFQVNLSNFSDLMILELQNNFLTEKSLFLTNLDSLSDLHLSRNKFNNFFLDSGFKNLGEIDLEDNLIEKVYLKLPKLEILNLKYNKIKSIETDKLKTTINILLDHNSMQIFPNISLQTRKKVYFLSLTNNLLKKIDLNNFENFENLIVLYLSMNLIEKIEFPEIFNLKEIYLDFNRLEVISVTIFKSLKNLELLDLSSNLIYKIEEKSFYFNTELISLCIDNNSLSELPILFNSTYLKDFSLSSNGQNISYISPQFFCFNYPYEMVDHQTIFKFDNLNFLNKCMLTQLTAFVSPILILTKEIVNCDFVLMAKKLNFEIDFYNYTSALDKRCSNFTLNNDCSNEENLIFNCSIDLKRFNTVTTWLIDKERIGSFQNSSLKCPDFKKKEILFKNKYFNIFMQNGSYLIEIIKTKNRNNFIFDISKKILNNTRILNNFLIFEYSSGSRIFLHFKTNIILLFVKSDFYFSLIVKAPRYFYIKSTGLIVNGCIRSNRGKILAFHLEMHLSFAINIFIIRQIL